MHDRKVPVSIRHTNYIRRCKAESELHDGIAAVEKKYKLTIFELIQLLTKIVVGFVGNGIELEEEEAYATQENKNETSTSSKTDSSSKT